MVLLCAPIFSCPGVEVSCWQDQQRQAVSIYFLSISKSFFINFYINRYFILVHLNFNYTQLNLYHSKFYFVGVCRDYFNSFTGQLCPYKSRQAKGLSCSPSSSYYQRANYVRRTVIFINRRGL